MYNLSKTQAFNEMKSGKKVTREYFSKSEYLYIDDNGVLRSEEGYRFMDWWLKIEPTLGKTGKHAFRLFNEPTTGKEK